MCVIRNQDLSNLPLNKETAVWNLKYFNFLSSCCSKDEGLGLEWQLGYTLGGECWCKQSSLIHNYCFNVIQHDLYQWQTASPSILS